MSFHSRFLETWFYWNNDTSSDDFITDIIVWATSKFANLKFNLLIEIYFSKIIIIIILIVQERKTNLHWVVEIPLGNVLPSVYIFALNEPSSTRRHRTRRVYVERGCLCLKCLFTINTNNSWLLKALLEELEALLFVWCTIDFFLGIYTN